MLRRTFAAAAILVLPTLAIAPTIRQAQACEVWVPLATRVQKNDLIVAGRIISIEPNKYSVPLPDSRGAPWDFGEVGVKRTRWLDDATVEVIQILKGQPEFLSNEVIVEGDTARVFHLLLDGPIRRSDGRCESISIDHHARVYDEGVWFLRAGEVIGVYRRSSACASLDDVEEIQECLRTLETNYAGRSPGFAPDEQTRLVTIGSNYNTYVIALANADGSVILTGAYNGDFVLAGKTWFTSPDWDDFIARLDAAGNVIWARPLGSGRSAGLGLARGHNDTIILVAQIYEACSMFGSTLSFTEPQVALISLSSDGRVLWTRALRGLKEAPRMFPHGNGYRFAGSFTGDLTCGNLRVRAEHDADWYIGSLNADGRPVTLRAICLPGVQREATGMIRPDGSIVMAGGTDLRLRGDPPRTDDPDAFVTAISPNGRVLWADTLGGRWADWFRSAAVASDGSVVASLIMTADAVSGFVHADPVGNTELVSGEQSMHLCSWDAKGRRLWDVTGGGDVTAFGNDGNIYTAGAYGSKHWMRAPAYFPPSAGDTDVFIECYDRNGRPLWMRRDGGVSAEHALSLQLLPDNRAVLVGTFDGTSFLAGNVIKARGWSSAFVLNMPLPTADTPQY